MLIPIRPIFMPERARALSADCAPGPGVLVLLPPVARSLMWRALMPSSCNFRVSVNHKDCYKPKLCLDGRLQNLASLRNILCCKHGCIWRGFIPVSLHLHTTYIPKQNAFRFIIQKQKHARSDKYHRNQLTHHYIGIFENIAYIQ